MLTRAHHRMFLFCIQMREARMEEDLHVEQVHGNLRRSLEYCQMFLERGRVQDICPGMPWRLDDELMSRCGGLAKRLRRVRQLFL